MTRISILLLLLLVLPGCPKQQALSNPCSDNPCAADKPADNPCAADKPADNPCATDQPTDNPCAADNPCAFVADFSSVETAFATLLHAINNRDMDLYRQCFAADSLEREGMASRLESDPAQWEELQAIFRGPQTPVINDQNEERASVSVTAPEAMGGGIGGMRFVKENGRWVVSNW